MPNFLAISEDGQWAVSHGWNDENLTLWDIHQRTLVYEWTWSGARYRVDVLISPDSQYVTGVIRDNHLLVYKLRSPASPPTRLSLVDNPDHDDLDHTSDVKCLWSSDGTKLVVHILITRKDHHLNRWQVLVFSLPSGALTQSIPQHPYGPYDSELHMSRSQLLLHSDNQILLGAGPISKNYQIWDLRRGRLHVLPFPSHWTLDPMAGTCTRINQHYVVHTEVEFRHPTSNALFAIEVFDMLAKRTLAVLPSTCLGITTFAVSSDDLRLTIFFTDDTAKTWELATQREIYSFQDPYAMASLMSSFPTFSPDGIHVLLCYNGITRLLRIADGICLATFSTDLLYNWTKFTPDGKTLCYTTGDGRVIFEPIGHLLS